MSARVYRQCSKKTGVPWEKRTYDPDNFDESTPINQALSAAHACLYGLAHSVIVALGCAPGLGFIHTGHERSFVYDVADLYKANISIPIAFEVTAEQPEDIGRTTRIRMRDAIADGHLLQVMVQDIRRLLLDEDEPEQPVDVSVVYLWDDKMGTVQSGVSYDVLPEDISEETFLSDGYGEIKE